MMDFSKAGTNHKILRLISAYNCILIAAAICYASTAFSQQEESYTIKRYNSSNGLPQNSIRSMLMDEYRFLWMTTEEGLVRFDGRNFKIYNQNNQPGINNDRFRWIMKTMDGKLLVSELTGTTFSISKGTIELVKRGDVQKPTKQFIRGTVPNLVFYLEGLNKTFSGIEPIEIENYPLYLAALYDNQYGVFLNNPWKFRVFKDKARVKDINLNKLVPVEFFTIDKSVYFFDAKKDLYFIDIEKGNVFKSAISGDLENENLKSYQFNKNIIFSSGYPDVHIKLENRLFKIIRTENPLILKSLLITKQLPANCNVTDAFFDEKSQNLFIGTDSKGLYVFHKNNLKTLIYSDQFRSQNNSYYSQCELDSNTIYTWYRKEFTLEGGKRSSLAMPNHSPECLIKDQKNRMYYSVLDTIYSYDLNTKTTVKINTNPIRDFMCYELSGDSILVGSVRGIGYIKDDLYHHIYYLSDMSPDSRIEDLKMGPDGNIWVARCKGVAILNLNTGMLHEVEGLTDICARVLYRDQSRIFIGTYGNGYYLWEKGKTYKLPLDQNQNLSHVHSFLIDDNKFMWMSTNKGLFRTSYNNILKFVNNPSYRIYYEYFGQDDGILNTEFNGGCSPPVLRLKNQYVSYPTMEGFVWFIPEKIPEYVPAENIIFDQILIDKKAIPIKETVLVPSNHENIEINFSTPYWGNSANLTLEYKLEGFNKDWIAVLPGQHSQSFSNLGSGSYEFKVRKLQKSGEQPYLIASILFDVDKMYYETPWFILLVMLAGIVVYYLLVLLISHRIIRKNNELELKIAERTIELKNVNHQLTENFSQLAQKEKYLTESINVKNRLISIISHDIITPLKFISMVSRISKRNPVVIDKEKLIDSMNDIEFASDKLYNNASNILNWMKFQNNRITPKMDHIALHDFIDEIVEPLSGMAETKGIQIHNLVPEEDIIVSDRNILMILLQNLLSNAIKYTDKGEITFSAVHKDDHYFITVKDNGIGMSPEVKNTVEQIIARKWQLNESASNHENGNQLGYYIIVDFLQLLNGTIEVESSSGKGTAVRIGFREYK